jgi:hypothetical protein
MNKIRRFIILLGILCAVILIGYSFVSIENFALKRNRRTNKTNKQHNKQHQNKK